MIDGVACGEGHLGCRLLLRPGAHVGARHGTTCADAVRTHLAALALGPAAGGAGARAAEHAAAAGLHAAAGDALAATALLPAGAGEALAAHAHGLAKLAGDLMDEARHRVGLGLTEDLARVGAGEEQHLAGARDGDVGKAALLLDAGGVADAVHMREQRLLHARHEHAVEFQALRGVHRHHGDRLAVLVHGVEIGA